MYLFVIILSKFVIEVHYNVPHTFSYTVYKNFLFVALGCEAKQGDVDVVLQISVFLDPLLHNTMTSP